MVGTWITHPNPNVLLQSIFSGQTLNVELEHSNMDIDFAKEERRLAEEDLIVEAASIAVIGGLLQVRMVCCVIEQYVGLR